MNYSNVNERNQLVDMVAQAVIDKMEEREKVSELADLVVQRVIALQKEEAQLKAMDLPALLWCPRSDGASRGVHSGDYAQPPIEKSVPTNQRRVLGGPRRRGALAPIGAAAIWY